MLAMIRFVAETTECDATAHRDHDVCEFCEARAILRDVEGK